MTINIKNNNCSYKPKPSQGNINPYIDRQYKKLETILNANNNEFRRANKI